MAGPGAPAAQEEAAAGAGVLTPSSLEVAWSVLWRLDACISARRAKVASASASTDAADDDLCANTKSGSLRVGVDRWQFW